MHTYLIEYGDVFERFEGTNADEWFWHCLEAIKRVIEDWNISRCPKFVSIRVRRELEDRGEYPWILVKELKLYGNEAPWIDLEVLEESREEIFTRGEALALAWRLQEPRTQNPCAEVVL